MSRVRPGTVGASRRGRRAAKPSQDLSNGKVDAWCPSDRQAAERRPMIALRVHLANSRPFPVIELAIASITERHLQRRRQRDDQEARFDSFSYDQEALVIFIAQGIRNDEPVGRIGGNLATQSLEGDLYTDMKRGIVRCIMVIAIDEDGAPDRPCEGAPNSRLAGIYRPADDDNGAHGVSL